MYGSDVLCGEIVDEYVFRFCRMRNNMAVTRILYLAFGSTVITSGVSLRSVYHKRMKHFLHANSYKHGDGTKR